MLANLQRFFSACALFSALCVATSPVRAGDKITCEQFKSRLDSKIKEGGRIVAEPTNYTVKFKAEGNPHIRYEFTNIAGITGNLNCEDADSFSNIALDIDLTRAVDAQEAELFILRSEALMASAICSIEPMKMNQCMKTASAAVSSAIKDHLAAKKRGDVNGGGDWLRNIRNGKVLAENADNSPVDSELSVAVVPGSYLITFFGPHQK